MMAQGSRVMRRLTIAWNARRSVVHSCSLFAPPEDSCIASALRKCSIASLWAPMFRPARGHLLRHGTAKECHRGGTHRLRRHCISRGYRSAEAAKLRGMPRVLLQACSRLTGTIQVYSIANSPRIALRYVTPRIEALSELTLGRMLSAASKQSLARS